MNGYGDQMNATQEEHEHTHEGERQVSFDRVLAKLREQIGELTVQLAIKDSVIEDLKHKLSHALATIDQFSPTEEIEHAEG